MKKIIYNAISRQNNRGAVAIMVGAMLTALVGFTALSVDLGHQFVVYNELQNAADAGALAGARVLYTPNNGIYYVNSGANVEARDAAIANMSDAMSVEVVLGSNDADIQRGLWDFDTKEFTSSDSDDPVAVNAIRVRAHRNVSPSPSYFAKIFGYDSFSRSAEAVAYRGFAGNSVDVDAPITLCWEEITDNEGNFDCDIGTMIDSGNNPGSIDSETGRWTNFNECDPDGNNSAANSPSIQQYICNGTTTSDLKFINTNNGELTPAMSDLHTCWANATNKEEPWHLIVPVILCPQGENNCSQVVAHAAIEVVWISGKKDPHFKDIPREMHWPSGQDVREGWQGDWSADVECTFAVDFDHSTDEERIACWTEFMIHFNIYDKYGNPYEKMPVSLYFTPDCDVEVEGGPGGLPFGVVSEYPKLVK